MKEIFLTGATGLMGQSAMRHIVSLPGYGSTISLRVLARPGKVNEKKLAPFVEKGVSVTWGDLMSPADVTRGVEGADIVLHVGGMVSPAADHFPEKTYKVNTGAMANVISAVAGEQSRGRDVAVVYIGSVAQYGWRPASHHWGRVGDPINVATYDKYALSKAVAERMLSESGLKRWVSLRQTGIMHPGILMKASDPITFHVPIRGCLEWVTDIDSGRLLANICAKDDIPESFWRAFYNIGGGASYRKDNYEFMKMVMEAVGCPPPEKSFKAEWFATQNFHGIWYDDSDELDALFHFRGDYTFEDYMKALKSKLPFYFLLAPLAPAFLIRAVMKHVAKHKKLGTLGWVSEGNAGRIAAHYGSEEARVVAPGWEDIDLNPLPEKSVKLNHGYDEEKSVEQLTREDLQRVAEFRGGKCVSAIEGEFADPDKALEWECSEGHRFSLTPRSVLKGGHWCGKCLEEISNDPQALSRQARKNLFLAQVLA